MKKQSITSKILFLFIIFTIIIIGIFWVLQDQFLNRFYIYNKVKQVKGYGIRIHEQIRDGNMDEEIGDYIEAVVEEIDGRMLIIDSNDNIIYQAGRVHMNRAGKIPGIYLKQAREGKVQYYHVLDQQSGHGHGLGQSNIWIY